MFSSDCVRSTRTASYLMANDILCVCVCVGVHYTLSWRKSERESESERERRAFRCVIRSARFVLSMEIVKQLKIQLKHDVKIYHRLLYPLSGSHIIMHSASVRGNKGFYPFRYQISN